MVIELEVQDSLLKVDIFNMEGRGYIRAIARHPAKFMGESSFYDILIISLFYQKIIDMS